MEADWARTYGRDFRADLFGPVPMGARRLRALIEGLPPDAMLWRRIPGWGSDEELLALNAEVTHAVIRVLVSAFSKKGSPVPKPLHVPRPGDRSETARGDRRKVATPADLARAGIAIRKAASA